MAENIQITRALADFWEAVSAELTYEDIRAAGGPSQPTLTKLAKGEGTIRKASADALEDAIGLERGSLRRVAGGGEATWRPEGPPGAKDFKVRYLDRRAGELRDVDVEDGYVHALAWAHHCWRLGAPRELYHEFGGVTLRLYKAALDASTSTEGRQQHAPAMIDTQAADDRPETDTKGPQRGQT